MRLHYLVPVLLALSCLLHADTVQYSYDAAGRLTTATYSNGTVIAYSYDKAGNLLRRSITGAQSSSPQISAGGIVNAASFQSPIARGTLASIFGSNLAGGIAGASQLPLQTTLGGVKVTVAGQPAPLIYVSQTQINFQVPFEAPISGTAAVVVTRDGIPSTPQTAVMAEYAAGVFTYARTATALDPVIVHIDTSLVSPTNPATANEILIVYATGVGSFDHPPATGAAAVSSPLANSLVTPTVKVGGAAAQVQFAGLTPGLVGLLQINIQLPATLPAGNNLPLAIAFGSSAAPTVNLAVR
jgi:uncharacterized protein (TIGR03437 family)